MNKIVDHTKIRINETITRLQRAEGYNKSLGKYTWVKITDKIEFDALSGMMYFRGLLGVNVQWTDYFHQIIYFIFFSSVLSKNLFRFLWSHLWFANAEERHELWKTDRFAAVRKIWELFSSNLNNCIVQSFQITKHYIQWDTRLYSFSIIQLNLIITDFPGNHWTMSDSPVLTLLKKCPYSE